MVKVGCGGSQGEGGEVVRVGMKKSRWKQLGGQDGTANDHRSHNSWSTSALILKCCLSAAQRSEIVIIFIHIQFVFCSGANLCFNC